jgi:shikimate kinase
MEYFVIIRGPLGCGKSTIAKRVVQEINGEYVELDKVLDENGLSSIPPGAECIPVDNFIKANDIIIQEMKDGDMPLVIDGCFYHKEVVEDLISRMPAKGYVFTLKIPVDVCVERDSKRNKSYGESAARAVHALVSRFDYGTNIDVTKSIEEVVQEILSHLPR